MPQPNKRPRKQLQSVRSDHDEHHRPPHIHVGDRQTSSSTRPFFNAADNNTPHIPIGDRHMSSSTRRVYAADFNIPGGESPMMISFEYCLCDVVALCTWFLIFCILVS